MENSDVNPSKLPGNRRIETRSSAHRDRGLRRPRDPSRNSFDENMLADSSAIFKLPTISPEAPFENGAALW